MNKMLQLCQLQLQDAIQDAISEHSEQVINILTNNRLIYLNLTVEQS